MTELVLSKRLDRDKFTLYHETYTPFDFERVVGVSLPASKPVWEYKYKPNGIEIEESLAIDTDLADRIVDFYGQTKARKPKKRPFHNCHMFALYAAGAISKLDSYKYFEMDADDPVATDVLELGKTYAIMADHDPCHSVIGINKPERSLSVLGDYGIMAVVNNALLMDLYQGNKMLPTTSLSASLELPEHITPLA